MEINFDTFKPRSTARFNKLSLDKDEQVRACFVEQSPRLVYVHTFNKIVTDEHGKPIEVHDTWQDGSPNIHNKTEYAGKLRCLGDPDVISNSGADPENCAACRAHIEHPNAVRQPEARIIGHLLKYKTKPGSFQPSTPFSADLVVWDLTARRFGQLQAIYQEHGNLANIDLLLGPCDNKNMQKFDIAPGRGKAYYQEDPVHTKYVTELFTENRVEDLESVAGKLPTQFEMETKVNEIIRAYNHAFNTGSGSYSSLLASDNVETVAAAADVAPTLSPKASNPKPFEVEITEAAEEPKQTAVAPDEAPAEVEHTNATTSLDDMLKAFGA